MKIQKRLLMSLSIISIVVVAAACGNKEAETTATTETSIITEVQEISKSVDEVLEANVEVKPTESIPTSELITNALLKHYNSQFGNTNSDIKSVGYKMFLIEDGDPGYKRAYGFAKYREYNIVDGELEEGAGSGTTGIAISFSLDGKNSEVLFEILTDDDTESASFKSIFPQDVQEKIIMRNNEDTDEVDKSENEMMKKLYKEKTGKEYTE